MKREWKKQKKIIAMAMILALTTGLFSIGADTVPSVRAAECGESYSHPQKSNGVTTWDCVYFGNYWQNDTNGDGVADESDAKTPIKWRVLEQKGNEKAVLLADQILDGGAYADTVEKCTWESSDAYTWCQETFWNQAFTADEQAAVLLTKITTEVPDGNLKTKDLVTQEYVYLPSMLDLCTDFYGFNTTSYEKDQNRAATNTAYCGQKEGRYAKDVVDTYWCRESETYKSSYYAEYSGGAYQVMADKDAGIIGCLPAPEYVGGGYRPMLVLDLSKTDVWSAAGTIITETSSTGTSSTDTTTTGTSTTPAPATESPETTQAPETTETATTEVASPSDSSTQKNTTRKSSTTTSTSRSTSSYRSSSSSSYSAVKKPKKVTLKKIKATGKRKVNVVWKWFSNQSGFQLQYARNRSFSNGKITKKYSTYSNNVTVKRLKKGKTYYFRIRAYKKSGSKIAYGKWSTVKKVKVK